MTTMRKKRPLNRERVEFRDARLFVIATEGKHTEPQYFRLFHTTKIQIEILPTEDGASSPQSILNRIDDYRKSYDLGEDDQLFVVIDRDRWPERTLSQVSQHCSQRGYILAVSNPCFELWLYLHFLDVTDNLNSCNEFSNAIRDVVGEYNKTNLKSEHYSIEAVCQAASRAASLDISTTDRWPQSVGTHVYKILEELLPFIDSLVSGDR